MSTNPTGVPIKDSIQALEQDAELFARTINKLRNTAYELNNMATVLDAMLREYCVFIDDLKAQQKKYAPSKGPITT